MVKYMYFNLLAASNAHFKPVSVSNWKLPCAAHRAEWLILKDTVENSLKALQS